MTRPKAPTMADVIRTHLGNYGDEYDLAHSRSVRKLADDLAALCRGVVQESQARAYDKGYGHGRHDGLSHPPFTYRGLQRPPKSRRNPYRSFERKNP